MFAVLGASGNTGRVVVETLLGKQRQVRAVLHATDRSQVRQDARTEVALADVEDEASLRRAFEGVEGAYVLLPPNFSSTQVRIDNGRRIEKIAAALAGARVAHVVMLSSVGAQQGDGTGPVLGIHDAEQTLGTLDASVTFLRAAYFMENWAVALQGVARGVLPTFLLADRSIPMVATRDIGTAAARLLLEGRSGKKVIELAGPRDYSPRQVGGELEKLTAKPIAIEQYPDETMAAALAAGGMNSEWARLFQELTHGINVGRVAFEGGHPLWRGETEVGVVLGKLLGR